MRSKHGGPVRVVTPGKYFYRPVEWLKSIEFPAADRLGWWEANSSYHSDADPTPGDQRFTTGSLRPEQIDRFESAFYLESQGVSLVPTLTAPGGPAPSGRLLPAMMSPPDVRRLFV